MDILITAFAIVMLLVLVFATYKIISLLAGTWAGNPFAPGFRVEYYPRTKRYYPRYKWGYLSISCFTGLVELENEMMDVSSTTTNCKTKEEAEAVIELYKEQHHKNMVEIIKYK